MTVPDSVYQLVEKFTSGERTYKRADYNETQLRVEFVNPLFEALGWDVRDNTQVSHEIRVLIEGKPKRPDYGFRIGGTTHFYLETKKPSLNLKDDPSPAYQLRRYGWSGNLPISILSDFEEFIIYDCRLQPHRFEPASKARLNYYRYPDYVDDWDKLYGLFSREAVADGALRKWIEDEKPRGALGVDQAFLREMEAWRESLAKDMALHNRHLNQRELNHVVQRTIDRIVFLRIAEDRNIESYGRLQRAASEGKQIYQELKSLFNEADDKYNSGLFHFDAADKRGSNPDQLSLNIHLSNPPLRDLIDNLYYPNSPYEFSVLPADILGQVYERFLGKVIELTATGAAKIEEKPEVRKAGGVYYTPTYIVDYIVQNTVGKLLEGKTPDEAAKLRILDPACGSGSFLTGAYQYLLDWHLNYYREHPTSYRNNRRETPAGMILTTAHKRDILRNNIYGVDLDQNAVEVSKLSLLLKMLENEDESAATGRQTIMFAAGGRILPDLSDNIKWGNSLIGSDFYSGKQMDLFDDEQVLKVKPFDWKSKTTGFGDIMANGGFDAVIGNPPYIRIQTMKETAPETLPYYKKNYVSASKGNYDIYVVFVERGLQLLSEFGLLGFILPHKFFNAKYGEPLRGLIAKGQHLRKIVHFGAEQVFTGATTYTCLLFLKQSSQSEFEYLKAHDLDAWIESKTSLSGNISNSRVSSDEWNFVVGNGSNLFYRLADNYPKLGELTDIFVGLQTSADKVYIMDLIGEDQGQGLLRLYSNILKEEVTLEKEYIYPIVSGTDVVRYHQLPKRQYIIFPYDVDGDDVKIAKFSEIKAKAPRTAQYLLKNKSLLENREKGKMKHGGWYGYIYRKNMTRQQKSKLCIPRLVDFLYAAYDEKGERFLDNVDVCGIMLKESITSITPRYILGLLNSTFLKWYFPFVSAPFRGNWLSANRQFLSQLPIREIDFDNPDDVQMHDEMVKLVNEMLDLHRQLPDMTGEGRRVTEMQIEATDTAIDKLVYRLYGLSEDEVAVVGG